MNGLGPLALLLILSVRPITAMALTIPTVFVGNRGNLAERYSSLLSQGAVDYNYRIGTTEVTNAQYVAFLNAVDPTGTNLLGLYNPNMATDAHGGIQLNNGFDTGTKYQVRPQRGNFPVVYVSWFDAIRFTNWLHNGQGSGDTETGAYTLGALDPNGVPIDSSLISRNPGARWWLPSNDEWYKAGFHKNDGTTGNYWEYPTSTNDLPYSDQPPGTDAPDPSNTINFFNLEVPINGYNEGYAVTGSTGIEESQNYLTEVGAYTLSVSPYGTYDQGGNVYEWNDSYYSLFPFPARGLRGGSWVGDFSDLTLHYADDPSLEARNDGFRVATIPEPNTLPMIGLAVAGFAKANCGRCICRGRIRKTVGLAY